jgi:hypothetical protein
MKRRRYSRDVVFDRRCGFQGHTPFCTRGRIPTRRRPASLHLADECVCVQAVDQRVFAWCLLVAPPGGRDEDTLDVWQQSGVVVCTHRSSRTVTLVDNTSHTCTQHTSTHKHEHTSTHANKKQGHEHKQSTLTRGRFWQD